MRRRDKPDYPDLASIMVDVIKDQPKWYENFKRIHGFELITKNPDGIPHVEFSKDGISIQVTPDKVRCKEKLTEDNMKQIAPALIALFLKCTDKTDVPGCTIADATPEAVKYIENLLANELMKRSPSNASYTINGMAVEEIVMRSVPEAKPTAKEKEPEIDRSFTSSM